MFKNIGGKIKGFAKVVCWIGIIVSVISGIVICIQGGAYIALGIATIVIGALIAWISSFTMCGFGQLVEDTEAIRKKLEAK